MKSCKYLLSFLIISIFFISCGFFKTLTESEFASATGKDSTNLSLLAVPPCILSQQFSKSVTDYTVSIPSNISSIAVVAKTETEEALLKINGLSAENYSLNNRINVSSLNTGDTMNITVEVKNNLVNETKNYHITATKTSDPLAFNEDFETGNFLKYGWIINRHEISVSNADKYQGLYAAKFGQISYDKIYRFSTFVSNTSNAMVTFYYIKPKIDYTYPNYIYLTIIIDDSYYYSLTSELWQLYSFTLPPGEHILSWSIATEYVKIEKNTGFIDNIHIQ